MKRRNWKRDELIIAINLYFKTPFGKIHTHNPSIIKLAKLLDRTPSSISWKLVNFASFDPSLKARGIKGAYNVSKLDKEIWKEFFNNLDSLSYESEKLLADLEKTSVQELNNIDEIELPQEGKIREQIIKARVNQSFFRKTILSSYNNTCCVTGLQQIDLLVAGHIIPWGIDEKNRLNPRNGVLLNALHDKAFENGLFTITTQYKIILSPILKKQSKNKIIQEYFLRYDNSPIILPTKFYPDKKFLEFHFDERFKK